jgi:hypothetical protein
LSTGSDGESSVAALNDALSQHALRAAARPPRSPARPGVYLGAAGPAAASSSPRRRVRQPPSPSPSLSLSPQSDDSSAASAGGIVVAERQPLPLFGVGELSGLSEAALAPALAPAATTGPRAVRWRPASSPAWHAEDAAPAPSLFSPDFLADVAACERALAPPPPPPPPSPPLATASSSASALHSSYLAAEETPAPAAQRRHSPPDDAATSPRAALAELRALRARVRAALAACGLQGHLGDGGVAERHLLDASLTHEAAVEAAAGGSIALDVSADHEPGIYVRLSSSVAEELLGEVAALRAARSGAADPLVSLASRAR